MKYNWNWGIFWQLSPDGHGTYLDTLIAGLGWTLATALSAWVIALLLGVPRGARAVRRTQRPRSAGGQGRPRRATHRR